MKELEIDGYFTPVENEILDFLPLIGLTKRELEFAIVGIRLLNGFGKEKDKISLSQFKILTGVDKGNGSRVVKRLIKKKIFYKDGSTIGINRDFKQWAGVANLTTCKGLPIYIKKVVNSYNKRVANLAPSKETSKETIKRKVLSKKRTREENEDLVKHVRKLKEDLKRDTGKKK